MRPAAYCEAERAVTRLVTLGLFGYSHSVLTLSVIRLAVGAKMSSVNQAPPPPEPPEDLSLYWRRLNPMRPARRVGPLIHSFIQACRQRRLILMAVAGLLCGMALLLFRVSNAASYLSDAPETCINCHVMTPYYASWQRSSHREEATCNDCHVPQDNIFRTYYFKATDGMRHTRVFALRQEPQTLVLNPAAVPVIQQNCVRCHEHQIMRTAMGSSANERLCWECHRETPHGLAQSLSSSPHVRRPSLPSAGIPRPAPRSLAIPTAP